MRWVFYFVGNLAVLLGGLMGIFAATGVCAVIWGGDILHTALGEPPQYDHPAFWLFMLLMVPGMIVGMIGAYFSVYLPFQLLGMIPFSKTDRSIIHPLRTMATRLLERTKNL